MNATRSNTAARASHRLATHARVGRDGIERAFNQAPFINGRLIFDGRDGAEEPDRHGCLQMITNHALAAATSRKNPGFGHDESVATAQRLNAFFAISVNSPSLSMVNFSCCVCSAPNPRARGVTRTVTPQPKRAAVRMEAGVHADI
jgi:hypothetical protein